MADSYIQQSLASNEKLIHIGRFHWTYKLNAWMSIVWGAILAAAFLGLATKIDVLMVYQMPYGASWLQMVGGLHPGVKLIAALIFAFGLFKFAHMMVICATTEIAVTSTRIILKRGLVARYVGEMNVERIESINVMQSVFGRIFDYGSLIVHGMGVGAIVIPPIAQPILFRRAIEHAKK